MNVENFRRVLEHIKAHPEDWDQSVWHCGTTRCFAGHAQIMSGKPADHTTARRDARAWLDLSSAEANYFFAKWLALIDFERAVDFGEDGYCSDGYDRSGYDRDGYNRAGYSRDGYDRAGYSRSGYDRHGYDSEGLDRNNNPRPE